ncbi:hypothetical protein CIB93_32945 [Streptomyces sp. WZ.A104]|uniref:hypothetical protein n=1 Tax=Streptomyces sp. WZ.A104 TaxID=2023771 RepID=UPI000BBC70D1|nr:hypothetical protein [Streptomyces sp. WZ.A104]PCG81883.1 hypothetical protein CIB93_32945 [Streptomyces sp. WZ.A104]
MTTTRHPSPTACGVHSAAKDLTERSVPTWAERVAHAIPLVVLPVGIWRLPIGFGYGMGGEPMPSAWFNAPYVIGLTVLTEILALLSFGLVRRWGEVVPHWVPRMGGRRVPPAAAIVPAALGGLLITALGVHWLYEAATVGREAWPYDEGWDVLAMTMSGLMNLWGPLLLALTYAYYRRRRA